MSVLTLVSRPTTKTEVLATEFRNQGEQISCHRLSSCMVLQQCGYFDVSSNHTAVLISCQRLSSRMILHQNEFFDFQQLSAFILLTLWKNFSGKGCCCIPGNNQITSPCLRHMFTSLTQVTSLSAVFKLIS